MEDVQGGNAGISCTLAVIGIVSIGITLATFTGPFGVAAYAAGISGGIAAGGACIYEATH